VNDRTPQPNCPCSEERDGWRYQCFATDTPLGHLAFLGARYGAHARVEDRIRCGKDTGLNASPAASSPSTPPG
jgi:hypothetical protein